MNLELIVCPLCNDAGSKLCPGCMGKGVIPVLAGEDCFTCAFPLARCICPILGVLANAEEPLENNGPAFVEAPAEMQDANCPF